jgi:phenylacetate-CoA ligase
MGARILRQRYGGDYPNIETRVRERGNLDADDLVALRNDRLRRFITSARSLVPFYRECAPAIDQEAASADPFSVLATFPIIRKEDVKAHLMQFAMNSAFDEPSLVIHTSGTTGGGLRFPVLRSAMREQWATWWRYRGWHGLRRSEWCGYFGGRAVVPVAQTGPPFWRINYPGRQVLFSTFHMSDSSLLSYVQELDRRQLRWLHGYPSALVLIAQFMLERGLRLGHKIEWITTGAESLLPHQRTVIEQALGCVVREHYGLAEATANASECPAGRLHIDEDFSFVELLPSSVPRVHRIIGTNMSNPAFPLIRYDSGDRVTLGPEGCLCGRPGRILETIEGRVEDYVMLSDGRLVGRLDHIFKDLVRVREAQVFQPNLHEVIIRVVRGPGYSPQDESTILEAARQRLGRTIDLKIEHLEKIERTPTGKLRFVISNVTRDEG